MNNTISFRDSPTSVIPSVATEDTPTCFLVSAGASESTSFLRHLLSCDFLRRYADLYIRLRRRLRIDVTGYLRRHPLSCDFLRRYADLFLRIRRRLRIDVIGYLRPSSPQLRLLARYAGSYLRLRRRLRIDVTGYLRRHPLSCDFLRDTPTRILVSVGASESTSLDISAAIPSVATSCEIRRLVS